MTWIVTGGAGYIGAHVLRALQASGLGAVVVDDLSTGDATVVPDGIPLTAMTVLDTDQLVATMRRHRVEGVVHLAAKKAPAESVSDPLFYYRQNVEGMVSLLEAMRTANVGRLVLSSSSSVYGNTEIELVPETAPLEPMSPYGQTKVISEWLAESAANAYGLNYINLRYFNVAGTGAAELADRGTANLIPLALRAVAEGRRPRVFGTDYPTPDGSCIRDYVHVVDLADAHVAAATRLLAGPAGEVFNVGTGLGTSVFEVLKSIAAVTGTDVEAEFAPRRPGDPVRVVGDVTRIADHLGWHAKHDLTDMVRSAWRARNPPISR